MLLRPHVVTTVVYHVRTKRWHCSPQRAYVSHDLPHRVPHVNFDFGIDRAPPGELQTVLVVYRLQALPHKLETAPQSDISAGRNAHGFLLVSFFCPQFLYFNEKIHGYFIYVFEGDLDKGVFLCVSGKQLIQIDHSAHL